MVPDVVRPDDRDWSCFADLQTVRLGPLDGPFPPDQLQFLEALLEVIPGFLAFFPATTLLLFRNRAEEYLPLRAGTAGFGQRAFGFPQGFWCGCQNADGSDLAALACDAGNFRFHELFDH